MDFKLNSLTVENFVVFHDRVTIDFSEHINNIEGTYLHNSAQSNGAGKSLIIDAISLALFGKGIRASYLTDYISNSNPTGGIYIGLELKDENGKILKIERWRRPNSETNKAKLWYDGVCLSKDSTITRTDELLQGYIGVTHSNFLSCIFSVMVPGFLKLRPAQRFEILEQALAVKKVESVIKKINSLIRTEEDKLAAIESSISDKSNTLATETARQEIYDNNFSLIEENIKIKKEELASLFDREQAKLDEISKLTEFKKEVQQKLDPLKTAYSDLYAKKSALIISKTNLETKLATVLKAFKKKNNADGMECAVCKSPLSEHNRDYVRAHYQTEIQSLTEAIQLSDDEVTATWIKLNKIEITMTKTVSAIDAANKTLSSVIRPNIMACEKSIQESESALLSSAAFNKDLLATLRDEIKQLTSSKKEVKKSLRMSYAWKAALAKNGLRLAYIREEISTLSAIASKFASAVYEKPMPVVFFIDGEKDNPSLEFTVNGKSASMMSTGEARRLEIAMTLSLMALLKTAGLSLHFLVLDEALDGLSDASKQAVLKVIDSLSLEYQILMISHDPLIKQRAGKLIQVVKDDTTQRSTILLPQTV
ncbi:MAG: AAA family ATPase [Ignisphaera sp.]|nr:AAA family ATPase [Ignisphaera sp.]